MRQKSSSPIAENVPYSGDSYLHPASVAPASSTPKVKATSQRMSRDQYLTPLSVSAENDTTHSDQRSSDISTHRYVKHHAPGCKAKDAVPVNAHMDQVVPAPRKARFRRLRSASCEDLSDYLRTVVYDPVSKSMNDLLSEHEEDNNYMRHEPFPRLQTFSGVIEHRHGHELDNYYNIEGLRGKIYDGPGLTVAEIRKRFSKRSQSRIRRSVSNPNFIGSPSVEKLNRARISIGLMTAKDLNSHSSSLKDLLPEGLRRHLTKEPHHKGSQGALSSGIVSSGNSSKHSSRGSSRASSAHSSPYNSLSRKSKHLNKEDIVATTSVKGINITKRSRSFRRQKPAEHDTVKVEENGHSEQQTVSQLMGDNSVSRNNDTSQALEFTKQSAATGNQPYDMPTHGDEERTPKSGVGITHKRAPKVFRKPTPAQKPSINTEHNNESTTV